MSKPPVGWTSVLFSMGCLDPLICICVSHSWHPSIRLISQEQRVWQRMLRSGHDGGVFPLQSRKRRAL